MTDSEREDNGQLAPHATRLNLLERGWTPIPLFGKGQSTNKKTGKVWPEVPKGWPDAEITEDWLQQAKRKWTNTAIRTGRILAVDIDVTDAAYSVQAGIIVEHVLGATPFKRVGKPPKILFVYWLEEPQRKKRTKKWAGHMVEFLSNRSYFVAYGDHPDTKQPYTWEGACEPAIHDIEDLPTVTPEQVDECIANLNAFFEAAGLTEDSGQAKGSQGELHDLTDDMQFQIVEPFDDLLTWGELKKLDIQGTWFCHLTAFRSDSDSGAGLISIGGSGLHIHDLITGVTHYDEDTSFKDLGDAFKRQFGHEFFDDFGKQKKDPKTYHDRELAIQAKLPKLGKGILPDAKRTAGGDFALRQPTTGTNVGALLRALGVDVRLDLMTHSIQPRFRDAALEALTPGNGQGSMFVQSQVWAVGQSLGMGDSVSFEHQLAARAERFHPFEDWLLDGPTWDKTNRLNDLCETVEIVAEYRDIWPIYLKRWLIQCIEAARGWHRDRSTQKRSVLVLAGPQLIRKTTWLSRLVPPEFFQEGISLNFTNSEKDSVMRATETLIVELGELETTFKKSDAGALKAFLSHETDKWRPPYGKVMVEWPRCTSYAGTVNSAGFLVDETGSSRFWPVEVTRCNETHKVDMRQLWAEVNEWWQAGEVWYLNNVEETTRISQAGQFEQTTDVNDAFTLWFDTRPDLDKRDWNPVTVGDMAAILDLSQADTRKLGQLRGKLEAEYGRQRTIQGKRRAWNIPCSTAELNSHGIYQARAKLHSTD